MAGARLFGFMRPKSILFGGDLGFRLSTYTLPENAQAELFGEKTSEANRIFKNGSHFPDVATGGH